MTTLIFGGAFDPPHSEHIKMAKFAVESLGAEKLVIVPTYLPPHKSEGFLSYEDRLNLIKLAFDDIECEVVIDNIEFEKKKDNYTSIILPILKEKYGDIIYLLGGDSFQYLLDWKDPAKVVNTCKIAVVARSGYMDVKRQTEILHKIIGGKYIPLNLLGKSVSSALIKAKLLLGLKPIYLSSKVYQYILDNNLFQDYKLIIEQIKSMQSNELFDHSINVVLTAISLNCRHNLKLDFKKVFLSALLHDNAKESLDTTGYIVPKDSLNSPVLHQFLGAEVLKDKFNIDDVEIADAVRFHTTARDNMRLLEKLIYIADSVSYDRDYEPISKLREIAFDDFDKGFLKVLEYTYNEVKAKSSHIYPLTELAKAFYLD